MGFMAFVAAGCVSHWQDTPTMWPPEDYMLRVQSARLTGGEHQVEQRFVVWPDGTALYREASRSLRSEFVDLPVYERLSVYRLHSQSLRTLARQLHLAHILELDQVQGTGSRDGDGRVVSLEQWAWGRKKYVQAVGRIRVPMARLLRVVNGFLPEGREFAWERMGGSRLDRFVETTPPVEAGAAGALSCHLHLLEARPEDRDLLLGAFALACLLEQDQVKRDLFARIEEEFAPAPGEALFPERPGEPTFVEALRAFL